MTVVSSKEFVINQKKYFDLAVNEEIFIKRGRNMFHLINTHVDENDDDYITMDELREGVHEFIDKLYANK